MVKQACKGKLTETMPKKVHQGQDDDNKNSHKLAEEMDGGQNVDKMTAPTANHHCNYYETTIPNSAL